MVMQLFASHIVPTSPGLGVMVILPRLWISHLGSVYDDQQTFREKSAQPCKLLYPNICSDKCLGCLWLILAKLSLF